MPFPRLILVIKNPDHHGPEVKERRVAVRKTWHMEVNPEKTGDLVSPVKGNILSKIVLNFRI